EVLTVDLSELDPEARERLVTVVTKAIDKVCTVGRTLKAGTTVDLAIDVES
ncbi:MAG: OsmC family peroxiredoxin, partial [Rhodococcus sp. (in: high G+C Gram-positive bacteria)]